MSVITRVFEPGKDEVVLEHQSSTPPTLWTLDGLLEEDGLRYEVKSSGALWVYRYGYHWRTVVSVIGF